MTITMWFFSREEEGFRGRRGFLQEVVRSWGLIKKVTCYFTGIEIHEAKERRNLIEYVNHIILS